MSVKGSRVKVARVVPWWVRVRWVGACCLLQIARCCRQFGSSGSLSSSRMSSVVRADVPSGRGSSRKLGLRAANVSDSLLGDEGQTGRAGGKVFDPPRTRATGPTQSTMQPARAAAALAQGGQWG